MKNNGPFSSHSFICKLIDKPVARRIEEHLDHNYLNDSHQSAYVHSDIAEAIDEGSMSAFIVFELSAPFDVIDYLKFLRRLIFDINKQAPICQRSNNHLTLANQLQQTHNCGARLHISTRKVKY